MKKLFQENSAEKNLLALQTNSTHKYSQLSSQITEPISIWKVYFCLPPGEIYSCYLHLQSTLVVFRIVLKVERIFNAAHFFLESVGGEWGKEQRERPLESKLKQLGRKNKLAKENAAASNEPINLREKMIMAISESLSNPISLRYLICRMNKHPCSTRAIPSC